MEVVVDENARVVAHEKKEWACVELRWRTSTSCAIEAESHGISTDTARDQLRSTSVPRFRGTEPLAHYPPQARSHTMHTAPDHLHTQHGYAVLDSSARDSV